MSFFIRLALLLDIVCVVVERYCPPTHLWLPIGGDGLTQLGTLVVIGVVVEEGLHLGGDRGH